MKKLIMILLFITLLVGCWNSHEIDDSLFVIGAGINRSDGNLIFSTESIKPTSAGTSPQGQTKDNVILQIRSKSMLNAGRQFIRYAKRRLFFTHCRTWIIGEELAKEEFVKQLDILRRHEMLRLNSYLFITPGDPLAILKNPSLYDDLSSMEIISAIDQTEYNAEYPVINLREFYRLLEEETRNAHLPIITTRRVDGSTVTSLEGTAIINNNRMVGKLTINESVGLNILLNKAKGGSLTVELGEDEEENWATVNVKDCYAKIKPRLEGNKVKVDIEVNVVGLLGEYVTNDEVSEDFILQVEEKASEVTKELVHNTIKKLQQLETDAMKLGVYMHRKYPKEWQKLKDNWNEYFKEADVSVHVDHDVRDPGLLMNNLQQKQENEPDRSLYSIF